MKTEHAVDCNFALLCRYYPRSLVERGSKTRRSKSFAAKTLTLGVAAMGGVFLTATNVGAHDALPTAAQPLGWSYPYSCCSGYDCRGVADNAIGERPEGYIIEGTGEVIGYTDSRIKDSPDGMFHWCSVAGANDGNTICLFVPPRGF